MLLPAIAISVVENAKLLAIVPISLLSKMKLGVESLSGVVIADIEVNVGAVVSTASYVQLN